MKTNSPSSCNTSNGNIPLRQVICSASLIGVLAVPLFGCKPEFDPEMILQGNTADNCLIKGRLTKSEINQHCKGNSIATHAYIVGTQRKGYLLSLYDPSAIDDDTTDVPKILAKTDTIPPFEPGDKVDIAGVHLGLTNLNKIPVIELTQLVNFSIKQRAHEQRVQYQEHLARRIAEEEEEEKTKAEAALVTTKRRYVQKTHDPDHVKFIYEQCVFKLVSSYQYPGIDCPIPVLAGLAGRQNSDGQLLVNGECWWVNRLVVFECVEDGSNRPKITASKLY